MKHLLFLSLAATSLVAMAQTPTLHIDGNIRHQYVRGFGGFAFAATWGDNLTDDVTKALYSCDNTSKTLGYNILRARIAPDSISSWGSDNWAQTIGRIKIARNAALSSGRQFYCFASAWTPPGKFTSNGENTHGHILDSCFGDYADYLNRFIARCESSGTDVDYISLQNEPDYEVDYEGCIWPAKSFINFYANYADRLNRPLIGPESLAMRWALSDSILNNDAACSNLAILGGHLYGGGNFDYPLARQKGKEKWMTEYLINADDMGYDSDHKYDMADAVYFGRVVNTSMLANFSAWVHYAIKSSYGLVGTGENGTTADVITKRGYVLAHFAKYVSGTTRLHTVLDDPRHTGLSASAYLTGSGDTCVVMVLNPTTSKTDMAFSLPFLCQTYRYYLTNSANNLLTKSGTLTETSQPVLNIGPLGVYTFLFVRSNDLSEPQEAVAQPLWADSLQNYCGQCVHPDGWSVTVKGSVRTSTSGNSFWNSSQTRLFPYSPESPIPAGILLHASSSTSNGIASYGGVSDKYRLSLPEGRYRLIWHATGYNGVQSVQAYVRKQYGTTNLASHTLTTTGSVGSSWGSGCDCLDAVADTLDFEVTSSGNHILYFKVNYLAANAVDGSCMALVGGITLNQLPADVAAIQSLTASPSEARPSCYDILGRRLHEAPVRRVVVSGGRVILRR